MKKKTYSKTKENVKDRKFNFFRLNVDFISLVKQVFKKKIIITRAMQSWNIKKSLLK